MASTTPSLQLFVNKFITVNLERYADDAELVASITGLTPKSMVVDKLTKLGVNRRMDFHSDEQNIEADAQEYECAPYTHEMVSTASNRDNPFDSLATAEESDESGYFLYTDGESVKGIILYPATTLDSMVEGAVKLLVESNSLFLIKPSDVVVDVEGGTVKISTDTIEETLTIFKVGGDIVEIPPTDYGPLLDE